MNKPITLCALDGSNPLAFLAALGSFRLLGPTVRMCWQRQQSWLPEIDGFDGGTDELCAALLNAPRAPIEFFVPLGKNITVAARTFREFTTSATSLFPDRRAADFAAAFGSEVCEQEGKDRIEYTDFCFITGSGHQDFLGTIENLTGIVTAEHIREALFGPWTRRPKNSMRWDPQDAAEYALRWSDPGPEGASAVWGANLLAFEALPLFPVHPTAGGLRTTGFLDPVRRGEWPQFTWPIWSEWAGVDTIRSLLSLEDLCRPDATFSRAQLSSRGITEVFRAQRVRIGQGANFKVSFRPARAL